MSDPLPTEIIRELAGRASIGEPVWEVEAREVPVELEPDFESPAFQAGVAIMHSIDPAMLAKVQFLRDTLDNDKA